MSCGGGHLGFPIGIKNRKMSSTKFLFFYADQKSKMATTAGYRLTLDPIGKCSNAFFSETTNQTESKLDGNVSWISDRHKKPKFCRGPSNDHSWADWFKLFRWFQTGSVLRHFSHRVQC
jgi:hypothetical protein